MSNYRSLPSLAAALVCLGFTGSGVAWADPADDVVPTAPKSADGATARIGTSVGFVYGAPTQVLALGGNVALGQRFGRIGLEAEYTFLDLESREDVISALGVTNQDVSIGQGHRLAVMARFDLLRFGPHVSRERSLVTVYVEGGAGVAWNHWLRPSYNEMPRVVPNDTKREEGQGGFGLMIFPHRVAWLIGWRFALSPHEPMSGAVCRSDTPSSCSATPMMDSGSLVDRSMLFQSSLEFTF